MFYYRFYTIKAAQTPLVTVRQQCNICDQGLCRDICSGYKSAFCGRHYDEHRRKLGEEMSDDTQKHDELLSQITMNSMDSENPLLVRINKWEQQYIDIIHAVVNEARTDLKQALDQFKEVIKTSLRQVAEQLKSSRERKDYTEIKLKRCMEQL
jgi:hypothetical protein